MDLSIPLYIGVLVPSQIKRVLSGFNQKKKLKPKTEKTPLEELTCYPTRESKVRWRHQAYQGSSEIKTDLTSTSAMR